MTLLTLALMTKRSTSNQNMKRIHSLMRSSQVDSKNYHKMLEKNLKFNYMEPNSTPKTTNSNDSLSVQRRVNQLNWEMKS